LLQLLGHPAERLAPSEHPVRAFDDLIPIESNEFVEHKTPDGVDGTLELDQ